MGELVDVRQSAGWRRAALIDYPGWLRVPNGFRQVNLSPIWDWRKNDLPYRLKEFHIPKQVTRVSLAIHVVLAGWPMSFLLDMGEPMIRLVPMLRHK